MPATVTDGDEILKRVETRDFYQGACLVAQGYVVDRAYARGSDQMIVFKDVPARVLLDYINDKTVLPARALFDAVKALRTLLQTSRDSQGLRTGAPVFPAAPPGS